MTSVAYDSKLMGQFTQSNSASDVPSTSYEKLITTKKEIYSEISSTTRLMEEEIKRLRLAESELSELKLKYGDIKANFERISAQKESLMHKITDIDERTGSIARDTNVLMGEIAAHNAILEDKKYNIGAVRTQHDQIQHEMTVLKGRLDQDTATVKSVTQNIADTTRRLEQVKQEHLYETAKFASLTNTSNDLSRSLDDIKHKTVKMDEEIARQKQVIAEYNANYSRVLNEKTAICNEVAALKEMLEQEINAVKIAERTTLDTANQIDIMQRNCITENAKHSSLLTTRNELTRSLDELKSKHARSEEEITKYKLIIEEHNAAYAQVASTKNRLSDQLSAAKELLTGEKKELELMEKTISDTNKQIDSTRQIYKESTAIMTTKNKDIQEIANDIKHVEAEIKKSDEIIADSSSRLITARKEHDQLSATKNTVGKQLTEVKDHINKETEEIKLQENLLLEANKRVADILKKKRELTSEVETANTMCARESSISEGIAFKSATLNEQLNTQKSANTVATQQLNEMKYELEQIHKTKPKLQSDISESTLILAQEKNKLTNVEKELANIKRQMDKTNKECSELNADIENMTKIIAKNNATADELNSKKSSLDASIVHQTELISSTRATIETVKAEYDQIFATKDTVVAKLADLKLELTKEDEQIKISERAILELNKTIEVEKRRYQDTQHIYDTKNELLLADKKKIEELVLKISILDDSIEKNTLLLMEKNNEYDTINAEQKQTIELKNDITAKLAEKKTQLATETAQIKTSERAIIDINKAIEAEKRHYQEIVRTHDAKNNLLIADKKKIEDLTLKITKIDEENLRNAMALTAKNDEYNSVNAEYELTSAAKNEIVAKLSEKKSQYAKEIEQIKLTERAIADMNKTIEADKRRYQEILNAHDAKNNLLATSTKKIEELSQKIISLDEAISKNALILTEKNDEFNSINSEYELTSVAKNDLVAKLSEKKNQFAKESEQIKQAERAIADMNKTIEAEKRRYQEIVNAHDTKNNLLATNTKKIEDLTQKISSLDEAIAKNALILTEKNDEYNSINAEYELTSVAKNDMVAKLSEKKGQFAKETEQIKQAERAIADVNKTIEAEKRRYQEILNTHDAKNNLLSTNTKKIEDLTKKITSLDEEIAKNTMMLDKKNGEYESINAVLNKLVTEKNILVAKFSEKQTQLTKDTEQIKHVEYTIADLNKTIDAEKRRYQEMLKTHDAKNNVLTTNAKMIDELKMKIVMIEEENVKNKVIFKEKTEKYDSVNAEYKQMIDNQMVLNEQLSAITDMIKNEQSKHVGIEHAVSKNTAALEEEKRTSDELMVAFEKSEKELASYQQQIDDTTTRLMEYEELIREAAAKLSTIASESDTAKTFKNNIQSKYTTEKIALSQESQRIKLLEKSLTDLEESKKSEESKHKSLTLKLKAVQGGLEEIISKKKKVESRLSYLTESLEENNITARELTNVIEEQQNEIAALEIANKENKKNIEINKKTIMDLRLATRTAKHIDEYLAIPPVIHTPAATGVRIYILCHTKQKFAEAASIYGKYSWAMPILMKYQDLTFENAFWKQLYEIRDEWYGFTMVGSLSFKAYKKIDLNVIDKIIKDPAQWESGYYHFMRRAKPVSNRDHPHLVEILSDVCKTLQLELPLETCCNYWMCSAEKMIRFLVWYEEAARSVVLSHPLSMTNSKYAGALTKDELLKIDKYPYYTHAPFVFERLFISFFVKIGRDAL